MTAPALNVYLNGPVAVTADNFNTFMQTANVASDLRAFIGTTGQTVQLRGINTINDGFGGSFYWNASSTATDNNSTAIVPLGAKPGAWLRLINTAIYGAITQTATGQFSESAGAIVDRLNDRVFVGAATVNDGNVPSTTKDYCESIIPDSTTLSQFASLSTIGGIGALGASQSINNATNNSEGTIGVSGLAFNNATTLIQYVYGGYFEARHEAGVTNGSISEGLEVDITNQSGVTTTLQPYQVYQPNATYGFILASGGGASGLSDASCALVIGNNGAAFKCGILFDYNSITGATGTSGAGVAIGMGCGHVIQWYSPNGEIAGQISSTTTATTTTPISMQFGNAGLQFYNSALQGLFGIDPVTPTAGQTAITLLVYNNAGVNAVPVTLGATGSGGTGYRALVVPN